MNTVCRRVKVVICSHFETRDVTEIIFRKIAFLTIYELLFYTKFEETNAYHILSANITTTFPTNIFLTIFSNSQGTSE